jgi:hypothetical protein
MDELEKHTNITLDDHGFPWESDDSLNRDTHLSSSMSSTERSDSSSQYSSEE